ncbi:hypothetical protein SAY86_020293 [Trapa natans]|uniref:Uncharacterized protein n=1 Tax=Trapa natans TaxID=22666 RepID=A0AAN7R1N1_TRANT|nr:hypothetical protein SAY86_020293 [Trapa natans]
MSGSGPSTKHYLKLDEFIFHNLMTSGLEVHRNIYEGILWLHSYQDSVDRERIQELRKELQGAGIQESKEALMSILRVCSKKGDAEEVEREWELMCPKNYEVEASSREKLDDLRRSCRKPIKGKLMNLMLSQEH